jgi:hypothetical protein
LEQPAASARPFAHSQLWRPATCGLCCSRPLFGGVGPRGPGRLPRLAAARSRCQQHREVVPVAAWSPAGLACWNIPVRRRRRVRGHGAAGSASAAGSHRRAPPHRAAPWRVVQTAVGVRLHRQHATRHNLHARQHIDARRRSGVHRGWQLDHVIQGWRLQFHAARGCRGHEASSQDGDCGLRRSSPLQRTRGVSPCVSLQFHEPHGRSGHMASSQEGDCSVWRSSPLAADTRRHPRLETAASHTSRLWRTRGVTPGRRLQFLAQLSVAADTWRQPRLAIAVSHTSRL